MKVEKALEHCDKAGCWGWRWTDQMCCFELCWYGCEGVGRRPEIQVTWGGLAKSSCGSTTLRLFDAIFIVLELGMRALHGFITPALGLGFRFSTRKWFLCSFNASGGFFVHASPGVARTERDQIHGSLSFALQGDTEHTAGCKH